VTTEPKNFFQKTCHCKKYTTPHI